MLEFMPCYNARAGVSPESSCFQLNNVYYLPRLAEISTSPRRACPLYFVPRNSPNYARLITGQLLRTQIVLRNKNK